MPTSIMTSTMVFISTKMLLTASAVAQCLRYKRANSCAMRLMIVPSPDPQRFDNCVRVYYAKGYHVDMPVYRRIVYRDARGDLYYYHELASTDWKRSDARHVNEWFERENNGKSPDTINGRQLRRIVRQVKKFARSRESW